MKLYPTERPLAPAAARALVPSHGIDEAHTRAVGIPAALGAPTILIQHETVRVQRTQAQWSWNLADQRSNGFAAKAIGMGLASLVTDVKVNGAPPRGKPV